MNITLVCIMITIIIIALLSIGYTMGYQARIPDCHCITYEHAKEYCNIKDFNINGNLYYIDTNNIDNKIKWGNNMKILEEICYISIDEIEE